MKTKILIVEDELVIALDIKGLLEEWGYEAIIDVTSVEDAIVCIEKEKPNLVLIDINLNKNQTGDALGAYLLEKDNTPYIYLTSYCDKATLDRVNKTRPDGYVVKPFKDEDLMATISVVLNNYKHRILDTLRSTSSITDKSICYKLKAVTCYINANIHKKLEIDELTKLTQWKRDYFIKIFSKYLQISPYQYILKRKIDKAKLLLEQTDIPINEIAFELGFNMYSNFCSTFKKNIELTPENYRKRFRGIFKA
jgi:AraC-like DNA-binding protein/CheY-like chemotaxis protein